MIPLISGVLMSNADSRALRALLLIVCLAGSAWAQVDTGTIAGAVKDPSGGIVGGASVVIRNSATTVEYKLTTNSLGQYVSIPLPPGDYTVAAQAPGFQQTVAHLTLQLNQRGNQPGGTEPDQSTHRDSTYLQFRCEVFNMITSAGSKPTLQRAAREIQLALKLYF